jgi:hypothetical protein
MPRDRSASTHFGFGGATVLPSCEMQRAFPDLRVARRREWNRGDRVAADAAARHRFGHGGGDDCVACASRIIA